MDDISNDERLRRIPMDVAAVIGAAERGDPDIVQENIEELTRLFAQMAASYAAVVTTIGMHREPSLRVARDKAVALLDAEIARQMDMWKRMGPDAEA